MSILVSFYSTLTWQLRYHWVRKLLSHCVHLYFFSSAWMATCLLRKNAEGNLFLQTEHSCLNSDWSIWLSLTWMLKLLWSPKALPQNSHTNGFSPVCNRICRVRTCLNLNSLWHSGHWNRLLSTGALADLGLGTLLILSRTGVWEASAFEWFGFASKEDKSVSCTVSVAMLFAKFSTWLKKLISLSRKYSVSAMIWVLFARVWSLVATLFCDIGSNSEDNELRKLSCTFLNVSWKYVVRCEWSLRLSKSLLDLSKIYEIEEETIRLAFSKQLDSSMFWLVFFFIKNKVSF